MIIFGLKGIKFNRIGVSFKGSGSYVPDQILTNQKISSKVDTSDEWIKSRTGISQRRIAGIEDNVTKMGYEAALAARRYSADKLNLNGVVSFIDPINTRSVRLAHRLGAKLEARIKLRGNDYDAYRHPVSS